MSAIKNPYSETEAREKIESILPDSKIRKIALEMLADSIIYANSLSRNIWAVTNTDKYAESIWLQAGHYAVFILEKGRIWMSLDKQLIDNSVRDDLLFTQVNKWGWQPDLEGTYQYKDKYKPGNPFSINGYYQPVSDTSHPEVYPELKRLHFEFLYKVSIIGQSIHKKTQNLHLPGVLMYLRNELDKHIPDPLYY